MTDKLRKSDDLSLKSLQFAVAAARSEFSSVFGDNKVADFNLKELRRRAASSYAEREDTLVQAQKDLAAAQNRLMTAQVAEREGALKVVASDLLLVAGGGQADHP